MYRTSKHISRKTGKRAKYFTHSQLKDLIGKLTYSERQRLPASAFAIPETRAYPIYNPAHARNALARVSRFGSESEKHRVCIAVARRYPKIHEESCPLHDSDDHSSERGHAGLTKGEEDREEP